MKWYEVVEDLGDGSSATYRFKTEEEAELYESKNFEWCHSGVAEVDTDSPYFFHEYDEDV